jgi:hypothetical protein
MHVDVIRDSANRQRFHFIFFRHAAEIWSKALVQIRSEERLTILYVPNAVNEPACERLHDSFVSAESRLSLYHVCPALKGWAIFRRSY